MSITNFPNGISSMGVPVLWGGLPATSGKYIFVDYTLGSDGNNGEDTTCPVKTVAQAYSLARTNKDDVIVLMGNASHVLSAMVTVSKNRVHFIWMDWTGWRLYGQNAKISMGITSAVTDVFWIKDTGVRNSYTNIKFVSTNTLTQHVAAFGWGWEYTLCTNCEMYADCIQDSNTHAEMVCNIDSPQFFNCTFGSLATAVTWNKIRPAILLTAATVAAWKVTRDAYFDNCRFWKNAWGTATAMIKWAATDIERVMEFHDCQFVANVVGSVPAVAIDVANLTVGQIILTGDTAAFECTKIATATNVISGLNAKVATATIGVQAT